MCGIAGYLSNDPVAGTEQIARMSDAIAHRGPDDEGFVLIGGMQGNAPRDFRGDGSAAETHAFLPRLPGTHRHTVAMAHRRYSVFDLSVRGHQPMWDAESELCVSFNGEIYNHPELREELESAGFRFVSTCDTEVLLNGFRHWGGGLFERLNGPFAIALYDCRTERLVLARDRLGKSPLYTTRRDGCLFWGSEIKAIRAACGANAFAVRPQAVDDYLVEGLRDADGTFWQDVDDFPPAHWAIGEPGSLELDYRRYWDFPESRLCPGDMSPSEAAAELRVLLADSLRLRMRADVPVAFELSGGLDSSSLVAIAAADLGVQLKAFSVRFAEPEANEEAFARAVCQRYGDQIDCTWFSPPKQDFWAGANHFVHLLEEPFHSPNLHTLHRLRTQMRSAGARVVVAGSAGDEVLAGYAGDYTAPYLFNLISRLKLSQLIRSLYFGDEIRGQLPAVLRRYAGVALRAAFGAAPRLNPDRDFIRSVYAAPDGVAARSRPSLDFGGVWRANMTWARMNYWLRSGNKATFGVPIESRAPFLDYRIVELGCRLPPEFLIRDGWFKWILRTAVEDILPDSVAWRRRKMGFPFPYQSWLASSKNRVFGLLHELDCPWLDGRSVARGYDHAARRAPVALWRTISLAMWWIHEVQGRSLGD